MTIATAKIGTLVAEKSLSQTPKGVGNLGESRFQDLLSKKLDSQNASVEKIMNMMGMGQNEGVKAVSVQDPSIDVSKISEKQEIRTQHKALELLTDVNRGALQMDHIIEMATSGKKFTPAELLGLQAGVHQIALNIDLTGKILEQVNSGTKQLLQTNFA